MISGPFVHREGDPHVFRDGGVRAVDDRGRDVAAFDRRERRPYVERRDDLRLDRVPDALPVSHFFA